MTLPNWIPKGFRSMMVTSRRFDEDTDEIDGILFLSSGQKDALVQNQMQTDKIRAVQQVALRIRNKEDFIKQSKGKAKKMLKEQLAELEQEQFELLRDEILSACKDSAGLLDMKKLRKVKGSREFVAKIEGKNKPKLNEGSK